MGEKMSNPYRKLFNEDFLEEYNAGMSDREIAKKHGLSHVSVAYRRYKLKLKANHKSFCGNTLETEEELEAAYNRIKATTHKTYFARKARRENL
jgi:hypothetical protein